MAAERKVSLERNTAETKISLSIDLDGTGKYQVDTGCGFLNHMLELFARHGRFDLTLKCDGDTQVDYHHTTEDIGIALGQAILEALGDKKGIRRYGSFLLPMTVLPVVSYGYRAFRYAASVGAFSLYHLSLPRTSVFNSRNSAASSLHRKSL